MRHLTLLCILLLTATSAGAQSRRGVLEIDHATGTGRFILTVDGRTDTTDVGRNPTLRVPRGTVVAVRVVGTNTALYAISVAQESVPVSDVETARSMVLRSAPYLPELRTIAASLNGRGGEGSAEAMAALAEADRALIADATAATRRAIARVDRVVQGRTGIQQLQVSTLYALERMRTGTKPETAAADLRALLPEAVGCGNTAPVRLAAAQELLDGVFQVTRAHADLSDAVSGPGYFESTGWRAAYDSAQVIDTRAQLVLDDYERLVTVAYRLERLVGLVAGACSQQDLGEVTSRLGSGSSMTIKVTPRAETELARVATLPAATWTVSVQPRIHVSPSLSLGGLFAPQGRLPIYGTAPTAGGSEVVRTGTSDARFTAAGMLGLTWGPLDRREAGGFTFWLPELVVGAGSTPTFGVGMAVSGRFLRLGVGAAWMRQRRLDGMSEGTVLGDASELRVSDSYGRGQLYVSLSVFDGSPLAARLR